MKDQEHIPGEIKDAQAGGSQALFSHFFSSWDSFLRNSTQIVFRKGQVIFYEGHAPYGVYFLESGKVRLSSRDEALTPPDSVWPQNYLIGLDLVLADRTYPFSATAETDAVLRFIPKSHLMTSRT